MPPTGIDWPLSWTDEFTGTLTQGGTDTDLSAAINLAVKASIEISIDVDYSNDAKATGGLFVYILRDINGTDYETEDDNHWGFEMDFLQNGTRRRTFILHGIDFSRFKIFLDWDNSTASSAATIATKYQKSNVPVAS